MYTPATRRIVKVSMRLYLPVDIVARIVMSRYQLAGRNISAALSATQRRYSCCRSAWSYA